MEMQKQQRLLVLVLVIQLLLVVLINVHGNSATASKLQKARTITITGGVTGTATSFDGSENISIPVTGIDVSKANAGTLPVSRGGTGQAVAVTKKTATKSAEGETVTVTARKCMNVVSIEFTWTASAVPANAVLTELIPTGYRPTRTIIYENCTINSNGNVVLHVTSTKTELNTKTFVYIID